MAKHAEHFLIFLLAIYTSFVRCLLFAHFYWIICIGVGRFFSLLYCLDIVCHKNSKQKFSPMLQAVSSFCCLLFCEKILNWLQSCLLILDIISSATRLLFRKSLPVLRVSSISCMLSSSSFKVFVFMSWSLIHFDLILVQDERQRPSSNLLQVDIQFSEHYLFLKSCLFSNT